MRLGGLRKLQVLWGLIATCALACAPAAQAHHDPNGKHVPSPYDVEFEGESMSVDPAGAGANTSDSAAWLGSGKHVFANGTAKKTVTATRPSVHLFVRIKPVPCLGAPEVTVRAGGKTWWTGALDGDTYRWIGVRVSLPEGAQTIEVEFTNNYDQWVGPVKICDRGVVVDHVALVAQPYSPTGWLNKPLDPITPKAANSDQLVGEIQRQIAYNPTRTPPKPDIWITTQKFSTPIYTVPFDQPTVRVYQLPEHRTDLETQWAAVPLPADAIPNNSSDGSLVVWQPSTNTVWEFWQLRKDSSGNWVASYGGRLQNISSLQGNWEDPPLGPGRRFGVSATSISILGTLPKIEEAKRGVIEHAIDFSILGGTGYDGWCWPAQRTDPQHYLRTSSAIPAGTRFRFPSSIDFGPNGDYPTLTPYARMLAKAMQKYGMVLRDGGDGFGFWAEDWLPTGGSDPYPALWQNKYPDGGGVFKDFPWDKLEALAQPTGTGMGCVDDPDVNPPNDN